MLKCLFKQPLATNEFINMNIVLTFVVETRLKCSAGYVALLKPGLPLSLEMVIIEN